MQCLNPIIAYNKHRDGKDYLDIETGEVYKNSLTGFHNLKKAYQIFGTDYVNNEILKRDGLVLLPCRKCVNCQLNRSREWAIRNSLEARDFDDDCKMMITLTYDNEHLHFIKMKRGGSDVINFQSDNTYSQLYVSVLCPKDVQLFLKRLRKRFEKYTIRFYLCGEYGGQTFRPHYHILLYGLPLRKSVIEDLDYLYTSNKNDYYNSKIIEKLWGKGFVNITGFSDYTAMYVSRYCTKKKDDGELNYLRNNSLLQSYNSMSRRPGIAHNYFINNKDDIYKDDSFIYHIDGKTWELKPIKYFDRQYDIENPIHMQFIKENRKEFYKTYEYFSTLQTNLQLDEYLENEVRVQNKYIKKRSL